LGRAAGYLSCAILLAYTHVYGLFLLIAHGLFALIWLPDLRLRMLVVGALVAAAFSPWLPVMLGQVNRVTQGFWIPAVTLASPVELISAWAGYNLPLALILIWLVAYDIARGEAGAAETLDFRRHRRAFLLLWIGVTAGVPAALSLLGEPIFRPKYTISGTAAFMLLVARALLALPTPWRRILGAAVVALLLAALVEIVYGSPTKEQYRELAALAKRELHRGTLVVGESYSAFTLTYYLGHAPVVWLEEDGDLEQVERDACRRGTNVLFIQVHPQHGRREQVLDARWERTQEIQLVGAGATRYRPRCGGR
jgi:hypothetical protein